MILSSPLSVVNKVIISIVGVVCGVSLLLLVGAVYGYVRVVTHLLKRKNKDSGNVKLISS